MRVGVVGAGYWGSKHVRVLHEIDDVSSVAVIDHDIERRTGLMRAYPWLKGYAHLSEALDGLDAVIVATPPTSHLPVALEAIGAGKHVLVEKPLATSVFGARQMVAAARQEGVVLMAGHTFEYSAAVIRLRDLVASGAFGRIHYVDSARLNLGLYQRDVNVVWDLAPHDVSICNYLLDDTPTSVFAWGRAHASGAMEDVATIRLDYANVGVTATIRVSWLDPCKVRRATVVGSRMMAVYDDLNDDERLKLYDRGVEIATPSLSSESRAPRYRYGDIVSPRLDQSQPLLEEDRDFVLSALGRRQPKAGAANGLAVVEVLEAADRSIRERREVRVGSAPWADDVHAAAR